MQGIRTVELALLALAIEAGVSPCPLRGQECERVLRGGPVVDPVSGQGRTP